MLQLFLFLQIISISLQDYEMIVDCIFEKNIKYDLDVTNCPQKRSDNYYYRGKPEIISNIKNKYDSYSSVFTPNNYILNIDELKKFQKSTIFFIHTKPFMRIMRIIALYYIILIIITI